MLAVSSKPLRGRENGPHERHSTRLLACPGCSTALRLLQTEAQLIFGMDSLTGLPPVPKPETLGISYPTSSVAWARGQMPGMPQDQEGRSWTPGGMQPWKPQ